MSIIFFMSYMDGSALRCRPLPHQWNDDHSEIRTDLNVAVNKGFVRSYPVGTVFACMGLASAGAAYACISDSVYPVTESPVGSHDAPPREVVSAWKSYSGLYGLPGEDDEDIEDTVFGEISGFGSGSLFGTADEGTEKKVPVLTQIREKYPCPTISGSGYYIQDEKWNLLARNILRNENTIITGPMGTGKTEIVLLLGKVLGLDVHVYDMGSMHDPMSQMLGTHRLVKDPETGATVSGFDYAQFTRDIQQEGIILLDELSRAPLSTLNILFPCLDSRRMLPVEMAGGEDVRNIQVHPGCHFIATANIGVEYTGTSTIDKALMSRFFPVKLDFLPKDEEAAVLMKRTGCDKIDARSIVEVASRLRSGFSKGDYSTEVSTRETLRAAALTADGWSLDSALKAVFLPLYDNDEQETVKRVFVTR